MWRGKSNVERVTERREISLKDFGSRLNGREYKCLPNAVLKLAPQTRLRKRWQHRSEKYCDNDAPCGAKGETEARANRFYTRTLLEQQNCYVNVVEVASCETWHAGDKC